MMFENDLTPEPTVRSRIVDHLPIALVVGGALVALTSLHLAATGLIVAAAAHVLIGLVIVLARRHRSKGQPQPDTAAA